MAGDIVGEVFEGIDAEDEQKRIEREQAQQARERLRDFDLDEDSDILSFEDTLLAIPRGIEGFGRSIATLIPGVDLEDERFFGRSETVIGAGLESLIQFGIGFIPGLGVANVLGKTSAALRLNAALKASKAGVFTVAAMEGTVAAGVSDFLAFDGQEKNFSALIESIPALANPLTEMLATDEDDSQVTSRIKNVLEGAGLGAAFGILIESIKGLRAVRRARTQDATPETLRRAQVGAVDPGRAMEGIKQAEALKIGDESAIRPELGDLPPEPEPTVPVELDNGLPPDGTPPRQLPQEIPDEAVAFEISVEERANPRATTNPQNEKQRIEMIANQLNEDMSNIPSAMENEDAAHVLRAMEDVLAPEVRKVVTNAETLELASRKASALMGLTPEETERQLLIALADAADGVMDASLTQVAASQIIMVLADSSVDSLKRSLTGDQGAILQWLKVGDQISKIKRAVDDLRGEQGRAQQASKIVQQTGGTMGEQARELTLRLMNEAPEQAQKIMRQLSGTYKRGGTTEELIRLMSMRKISIDRQVFAMTNEYYINSLLGKMKTVTVQPSSASIATIYRPLEDMVGGLLTGNPEMVRTAYFQITSLASTFADSVVAGGRAFVENASRIDPGGGLRDDKLAPGQFIGAGVLGTEPGTWAGNAANWIGNVVGFPTRAIRMGDEISKNIAARSALLADSTMEGISKGMPVEEAKNFAEEKLNRILVEGQFQTEAGARKAAIKEARAAGMTNRKEIKDYVDAQYIKFFDEGTSEMITRAKGLLLDVTMQVPLPPGGQARKIRAALDSIPLVRFLVVPFFNTPVNIAKFVGQRIDVVSAIRYKLAKKFNPEFIGLEKTRSRFLQDMMSGDKRRRSEAVGRLTTGLSMLAWGGGMASSGMITGKGPSDQNQRRQMLDAGWLPYAIKTPNGYVEYLRMDPFATFFGLMADGFDALRMQGGDDDELGDEYISALLTSVSNNFTSRSFLQGIGQVIEAMSDPEKRMDSLVENYAANLIPGTLAQLVQVAGDDSLRDANGILERMQSRVPGLSANLAPRRNMLGEPIDRTQAIFADQVGGPVGAFYSMFVPIAYREVSSDIIRKELANLRTGFGQPNPKTKGFDLRDIQKDNGQTAYDRWSQLHGEVKVNGRTLRKELSTLFRSSGYRRLDDRADASGESPRIQLVRNILARYRAKAFDQMLTEYPGLAREMRDRQQQRRDRKRGLRTSGISLR